MSNITNQIKRVKKRDGSVVLYDEKKVTDAIFKAIQAAGEDDYGLAKILTKKIANVLDIFFKSNHVPNVENIQDLIEKILIEEGHSKIAKSFILYRAQRDRLRKEKQLVMDIGKVTQDYLEQADWRVNENSNVNYSLSGLMLHLANSVIANYTLEEIYPKEVSEAHKDGDMHIHDLGMGISGYCAGWSLRQLLIEGFNGVAGKTDAVPAKHLDSVTWQMINFIGTMQNEWAGAQAFSSFDTYLAPFVRVDDLPYKKVKQAIQGFVFNMNICSRWGSQCVSKDTDCLTEEGWKSYDQIKVGNKIATFNIKTKKIEYLPALMIKSYEYDGKLINLKNRSQDQLVTPDHKVVRKRFNANICELIEAYTLTNFKTPILIPNSADSESKKRINPDWVKLFAWLVSEGGFSEDRGRISIFQPVKNIKNCEEIRSIFKNLNFTWDEQLKKGGFLGSSKTIRFRLGQASARKVREKINSKKVPEIIKTLDKNQIKLFLETYINGDGHREEKGRISIYTKDNDIKDSIQELCVLCGWGTSLNKNRNDVWVINIIRNSYTSITEIIKKYYRGIVWCPTTKNGTFVARRNGKVFITGNSPFSNITLDWTCPEDLKNQPAIVGGKFMDFTYGDCQKEMDIINKALLEVMTEGDAKGRTFTFPIPTYNLTKEFNWDSENANLLFAATAKYGLPYFQNFINSNLKPSDTRSMCCRLRMDMRELKSRGNGLFGSGELTGSQGVVTINLPRIGYLSKTKEDFYSRLSRLMTIAKISLEIKRKLVQKNMDNALMPFSKRYLGTLDNHFSTIGINGMNECLLNFIGKNIATQEGKDFAEEVLDFMRATMQDIQEETGHMYNLEATPAEGSSYRFGKLDKKKYPDIITAGKDAPYYTNSTQLPVDYTADIFEALELQDSLQIKYTGGTVLHGFIGEQISNAEACKKLVKRIAENFRLPYFTISPTFSVCPEHGYIPGKHETCPFECGKKEVN